jgi:autoinducer 2-degrading protein
MGDTMKNTLGVILTVLTLAIASPASAQSAGAFVNVVELDINAADRDAFLVAAKENATASLKEPGCLQYNIINLTSNPDHVVLIEIYENEDAIKFHRTTDHFKKYQATTGKMVAKRDVRAMTSIALNSKPAK